MPDEQSRDGIPSEPSQQDEPQQSELRGTPSMIQAVWNSRKLSRDRWARRRDAGDG